MAIERSSRGCCSSGGHLRTEEECAIESRREEGRRWPLGRTPLLLFSLQYGYTVSFAVAGCPWCYIYCRRDSREGVGKFAAWTLAIREVSGSEFDEGIREQEAYLARRFVGGSSRKSQAARDGSPLKSKKLWQVEVESHPVLL